MGKIAGWTAEKLIRMAILLFFVSAVSFFLVSLSPVDPLQSNVGQTALGSMSREQVEKLKEYWGVGEPVGRRFLSWFSGVLHGDMGTSLLYRRPVIEVVRERFLSSLWLMLFAWIFAGVLGIALGILSGSLRGTWADRVITGYCMLTASTPAFWIGLVLLLVFAVKLHLFPVGLGVPIGVEASEVTVADRISHAFLPALTLGFTGISGITLHTRAKMAEIMESPYVLYARARGESLWQIVRRHGLRNVLLPALTLQFASISEIFGGSILVEQVFSYPGLGQAAVTAGMGSDVPLLLGITLMTTAFVFAGNLAADVMYHAVDPRMRASFFGTGSVRKKKAEGKAGAEGFQEKDKERKVGKKEERTEREGEKKREENSAEEKKSWKKNRGWKARTGKAVFLSVSVLLLGSIVAAGMLCSDTASVTDFSRKNVPPGNGFLFGTDWLGRDMFLRTIAGLSMSIRLGILAALAGSAIALFLGIVAAMGKKADLAVSGLIDLVMGIPHMLLLILISYACGKGFAGVVVGISLTHWPSLARVIRAEVIQIRERQYVKISSKLGMSPVRIACEHMFPQILPQFLTGFLLMFSHAILHEASITFLGFGLPPEEPAVGMILSESMKYLITGKWWLALFPGLSLTAVVLLFQMAGNLGQRPSAGRIVKKQKCR